MAGDIFTLDADNNVAVRTVSVKAGASETNSPIIFTTDENGNAAVRVVGAGGGGGSDPHNLGWYATQSALETAHPTASNGDWAIVGSTDTVWVWDSDTNAWKDTAQKGQVESVNGKTGVVVLNASDVGAATSEQGAKADTAIQSVKTINGQSIVGEGNVDIDALPDQTGQSGKFLTTDGTDAIWEIISSIPYTIYGQDSITIGVTRSEYMFKTTVAGLQNTISSRSSESTVFGCGNRTGNGGTIVGLGNYAVLTDCTIIGKNISVTKSGTSVIGSGNASRTITEKGFYWATYGADYKILSEDGTIPKERLVNVISTPSTMPELTVAGWSDNTQTVTVTGVTETNTVFVSPAPASASDYASAGIICTAQGTDSLTFTCTTVPTNAITVNVVIF